MSDIKIVLITWFFVLVGFVVFRTTIFFLDAVTDFSNRKYDAKKRRKNRQKQI